MTSTPNRRDRFYQESDLEELVAFIDEEGVRVSVREGLVSCLSWTVDRLQKATDERDIPVLEGQVIALKHVLDKGLPA